MHLDIEETAQLALSIIVKFYYLLVLVILHLRMVCDGYGSEWIIVFQKFFLLEFFVCALYIEFCIPETFLCSSLVLLLLGVSQFCWSLC